MVATLVDNAGADIDSLHKVVDKYGEDEDIQGRSSVGTVCRFRSPNVWLALCLTGCRSSWW